MTYGHYEQDNNTSNGNEAIEWVVLKYDSTTGQALLLSRYGLDAHRLDASTYQGWDKSEIRTWLNSTFLNAAFTTAEQAGIVTTKVSTPSYSGHSGGSDTQDKIWLLSRDEASTYFTSDAARKATPTKYAVAQGTYQYSGSDSDCKLNGTGCCWWWLRSPGFGGDRASGVSSDGSLSNRDVDYDYGAVRPAFWLNLNSADIYGSTLTLQESSASTEHYEGDIPDKETAVNEDSHAEQEAGAAEKVQAAGFAAEPVYVTVTRYADGVIASVKVDASTQMNGVGLVCENEVFTGQFIGKKGPFTLGDGIDGCAGATFTSQGVVDAINSLYQ